MKTNQLTSNEITSLIVYLNIADQSELERLNRIDAFSDSELRTDLLNSVKNHRENISKLSNKLKTLC